MAANWLEAGAAHDRLAQKTPWSRGTRGASHRRAHDTILRCRINAAFPSQVERRTYAALEFGHFRICCTRPGRAAMNRSADSRVCCFADCQSARWTLARGCRFSTGAVAGWQPATQLSAAQPQSNRPRPRLPRFRLRERERGRRRGREIRAPCDDSDRY